MSKLKDLNRFSNIWFFDATSDATLTANFKELNHALGIGEEVKDTCNFLTRNHKQWLCIFDGANDEQLYLKDFIPTCNHGNIIILTPSSTPLSLWTRTGEITTRQMLLVLGL